LNFSVFLERCSAFNQLRIWF